MNKCILLMLLMIPVGNLIAAEEDGYRPTLDETMDWIVSSMNSWCYERDYKYKSYHTNARRYLDNYRSTSYDIKRSPILKNAIKIHQFYTIMDQNGSKIDRAPDYNIVDFSKTGTSNIVVTLHDSESTKNMKIDIHSNGNNIIDGNKFTVELKALGDSPTQEQIESARKKCLRPIGTTVILWMSKANDYEMRRRIGYMHGALNYLVEISGGPVLKKPFWIKP